MAEQYTNHITATRLSAGISDSDLSLTVLSATGLPASGNFRIRIDDELLICTARTGTTLTVTRGAESSTAAAHLINATVEHVLTAASLDTIIDEAIAAAAPDPRVVGITIDGGGSAITAGVKGYVQVPFGGTITKATLLADQSGSIVIDVWKDTYANYPPTDADSITASAPPTLSSATKATDSTLTGWSTTVTAGDVFGFNVDALATSVTRATLTIEVTP